jgi:hypothetical protein
MTPPDSENDEVLACAGACQPMLVEMSPKAIRFDEAMAYGGLQDASSDFQRANLVVLVACARQAGVFQLSGRLSG